MHCYHRRMKTCSCCSESKNFDEFHRSSRAKDGRASACKVCASKRTAARYAANPAPAKARAVAQRKRTDVRDRQEYNRKWYLANAERIKASGRLARLRTKYGLSEEMFLRMLAQQRGLCAVCRLELGDDIAVDHDHRCCPGRQKTCGECVRGLLHKNCNAGLGMLGDDVRILVQATEYLLRHQR